MSKNITLFGQDFAAVPALNVPLQGGGAARFIDEDDSGGGDFSTATLTLNNQTATGGQFNAPVMYEDDEYPLSTATPSFAPSTSSTFQVILYKNMSEIYIDSTYFLISVSGNITSSFVQGIYYITGDCTITLTERDA